ncbi:suppressor of RPS4-RLD 1 family [Trichomonas vaginalis G3]|uniref:suppressor of RPS4-RLD 1 family n=1 Tax=Trichomonas vaginalis (strain ATCC PRA-98 / G3) TaxID=412133 RepID=UPI0021E54F48|nr:suppressor of RPS4-RLD 1 family [Trichomonas vaginalis G3]KAI5498395.1 suppressor of RPS4-RLD 1 family [Trichomonas vaginalis G3]
MSLEQDEILHKLIEDSDRIGQRCIPHVMEYTSNPRLVRALGLVTLYITFCMQKNLKKSKMTLFCDIVDISCQILSFVDLRHPVLHRSSKNNISIISDTTNLFQRYERKSPRFFGIIKPAFEKMRQLLSLSTPLENVDCSEYDFGVDEFTFSRRFVEQETTYIRYKNLGSRGCDFSIFPTCNLEVLDNIDKYLERSWFNMFDILERPKQIRALCVTLQLIWSSFILTNYNVEFSYSIIQAFMISNHGIEVDRLDNDHSTELFIRHMIDPYIVGLDSLLTDHFDHKGLSKLYSTSSIEFWRRMPTSKYLFDLRIFNKQILIHL